MKICVNGAVREMTAEEEAALTAGQSNEPDAPTAEERLEALEQAMLIMMGGNEDV